jgi:hypothetical protein
MVVTETRFRRLVVQEQQVGAPLAAAASIVGERLFRKRQKLLAITSRVRGNPKMASPEAISPRVLREITVLMNRTFFLACATVVTLSIAAASSTPAQAQPCSEKRSERERAECSIRSAIYMAVSEAEAARARQQQAAAARSQQQQQAAAASVTEPTAASSPKKSCGLAKEYYVDGAVKFRDTCTGEWAQKDNIQRSGM